MTVSQRILLRMRIVSGKSCRGSQSTHLTFSKFFPRKSSRLSEYVEKYGTAGQATDYNIIRSMRFACWINQVTDTHSKYEAYSESKDTKVLNMYNIFNLQKRHCE